ncbi:hypothetical protein, partial [Thiolapillus sp.]|uniref:hypothetical protein n=1 Tax=Thiolapillus sp. TaxID=2017437 RepID=UPI003AF57548
RLLEVPDVTPRGPVGHRQRRVLLLELAQDLHSTEVGELTNKRVFGLVIDFGTSQSPKSTRPLTTYLCPSRPGHQALRNNFASSLLLRTWLPMTGRRVRRPTLFSLWRKARRENSAASRLLGSTSLRFALHGWQR